MAGRVGLPSPSSIPYPQEQEWGAANFVVLLNAGIIYSTHNFSLALTHGSYICSMCFNSLSNTLKAPDLYLETL